jgi:hypothetical protein
MRMPWLSKRGCNLLGIKLVPNLEVFDRRDGRSASLDQAFCSESVVLESLSGRSLGGMPFTNVGAIVDAE